jgi:folylpolyglutamate synthase
MTSKERTYETALALLDVLASNRAVVNMIQNSNRDMNLDAIPEMLEWVRKAGYSVGDFNKLNVIHVAGTNGKGSVCAMINAILQQYGQESPTSCQSVDRANLEQLNKAGGPRKPGKIGLYTSPHLVTVRERIRINNVPISQSLFASNFFALWDRFTAAAASSGHPDPESPETKPGYFRYLTIMALHVFLQEGVETAIVECGIGGEYDSTNILTKDAVTVGAITKLGIDHVGMLGDTIEKIAWHKGGIIKDMMCCFTVPQVEEAMGVLRERAKAKGAVLSVVTRRKEIDNEEVKLGVEGDFQKDNASLAIAVAEAHLKKIGFTEDLDSGKLPDKFVRGLEGVKWEGRCEVRKEGNIEWCIDGAHTLDGIETTARWFAEKLHGVPKGESMLIFNQQTRDAPALVWSLHLNLQQATGARHIFSNAAFCTNNPYKVDAQATPDAIDLTVQKASADAWSELEPDTEIRIFASIEEAINNAREVAKDSEVLKVLVVGSLHLVGGFLKVLHKDSTVI